MKLSSVRSIVRVGTLVWMFLPVVPALRSTSTSSSSSSSRSSSSNTSIGPSLSQPQQRYHHHSCRSNVVVLPALISNNNNNNNNNVKSPYHDDRRDSSSSSSSSHQHHPPATAAAAATQRRKQSLQVGNDPLLSLNLNLDALARARAPERAQELYQRIAALHHEGYYSAAPDICSFNSVLKAWQMNPVRALEFWEAEAIPGRMNIISYNTFLLALARAGLYPAAESLLRHMQANNAPVRPDLVSYNTVLLAYAVAMTTTTKDNNNNNKDTYTTATDVGHRADTLLQTMIRGKTTSDDDADDDNNAADDDDETKSRIRTTTSRVDEKLPLPPVLDAYFVPPQPNVISFNTVISTWSEHPNVYRGAEKAEYWLHDVMMNEECHTVRPDVYTYTTVFKALGKCRHPSIPSRVHHLLDQMQSHNNNNESNGSSTRPNVLTYTTAIQALCYNLQIDAAYALLDTMLNTPALLPDTVTFTTLFQGWAAYTETCARAGDTANVNRALLAIQQLYRQMKELARLRPEASPDARTYTSILHAYAGSQHAQAGLLARSILREMSHHNSTTATTTTPPQTIHYNAALACYAKSRSPRKVLEAAKLWKEMRDQGLTSCTITYNTIIYAAANIYWDTQSFDIRQQSYRIGQYAFDRLQNETSHGNSSDSSSGNVNHHPNNDNDICPTSMTYRFYFKMLQRLWHPKSVSSTDTRIATYQRAFDLCCGQGCLDQIILDRILNSLTNQEATVLFGRYFGCKRDIRTLPPEWSRNRKNGVPSSLESITTVS